MIGRRSYSGSSINAGYQHISEAPANQDIDEEADKVEYATNPEDTDEERAENVPIPGDYDVEIVLQESVSGDLEPLRVDVVSIHDARFEYNFPSSVFDGGTVGPALFPDVVRHELGTITSPLTIQSARIEVDAAIAELALSVDGSTWQTASETDTFEHTFADPTTFVTPRLGLGRTGSRSGTTPRQASNPSAPNCSSCSAISTRRPCSQTGRSTPN